MTGTAQLRKFSNNIRVPKLKILIASGIEAIFCADALTEAKSVVKKLITIEEDLQSLEKGKEQLIQEGIFDKESAAPFTEKLRHSKKKTKELGVRAEDAVERLEDCSNDEEVVNELISEWNRHESSMKNLEELERLLRENAVKVSEAVCADKRRRADALKIRLDGWSRTVQVEFSIFLKVKIEDFKV
ncbi:unnamed protein product [Cylicostephanus goldi]|uniref:Uncharacterized protein n=1 Tax=Cylicostephanus goldi TaxID=71465 RepID=A0A3P7QK59_CYLGO|nr:unnamed protein product [Cylicostephanus goldi]